MNLNKFLALSLLLHLSILIIPNTNSNTLKLSNYIELTSVIIPKPLPAKSKNTQKTHQCSKITPKLSPKVKNEKLINPKIIPKQIQIKETPASLLNKETSTSNIETHISQNDAKIIETIDQPKTPSSPVIHQSNETANNKQKITNFKSIENKISIPNKESLDIINNYGDTSSVEGEQVNISSNKSEELYRVNDYTNTLNLIKKKIEKAKWYPKWARKNGIEGSVYIEFKVSTTGKAEKIRISKSSDAEILDKAAIKIIKKASPFPFLEGWIKIPIIFRLHS